MAPSSPVAYLPAGMWEASSPIALCRGCLLMLVALVATSDVQLPPGTVPYPSNQSFSTQSITWPNNKTLSKKNGLSLQIEYNPGPGYGYWPVTFTVTSPQASKADRSLTIRFHASRTPYAAANYRDLTIEQDIDLPAGATTASLTMLVPKLHDWSGIGWDVWVDGKLEQELSGMSVAQFVQNPTPGIDILRLPRPDIASDVTVTTSVAELASLDSEFLGLDRQYELRLHHSPLSTDWRRLSSYSVVAMSIDELHMSANEKPQTLAALREWVKAGGVLMIEDVSEDFDQLTKIDKLMGRDPDPFDLQLTKQQLDSTIKPDASQQGAAADDKTPPPVDPPNQQAPHWTWADLALPD